MSFARLSKKAVSYSSASITKISPLPNLAETEKSLGLPAIKKPGSNPKLTSIQVSMAVVEVFP